jgi:hypothetical protein
MNAVESFGIPPRNGILSTCPQQHSATGAVLDRRLIAAVIVIGAPNTRNPQEPFSANENASTSEPVASDGGIPLRRIKHELYARERSLLASPEEVARCAGMAPRGGPPPASKQPRNRRPPRAVGMVPQAARSQHRGQS